MKTNILKSASIMAVVPAEIAPEANSFISYIIGAVIALLIMGYLVYTLLRPDKF